MPKLCEYQNCRNRATYGVRRGCPLRCKEHRDDMKILSRICECGNARPSYNEPGETTAICCSLCKTNSMINIVSKRCKCGKIPIYNEPGETTAICCSSCKTETMINVIDKKCSCGKIPTYNEPGETTAIYCSSCKTNTMIDVKSKKCKCGNARPSYNEPGETTAICCSLCKTNSMINIVSKRCKCGKIPNYNEPGETTAICCSSCKTNTMIDVKSKKCKCGKAQPTYNEPGETTAIYCSSCKTNTMVNVKSLRCPGLINDNEPCPNNTIGNLKYKNYCTECYRRNFPLDPLTFQIRSKTKEIAVRDYINANLEGFQHNKRLSTSHCDCTVRRSIDHRTLINNTLLVIETDENQHKSYDQMDEETRYDDLYMAFPGKWIYIRFNPDKYVAKNGNNKNPMISTRLPVLLDEIKKQIIRIEKEENTELVERIYMYYDNYD